MGEEVAVTFDLLVELAQAVSVGIDAEVEYLSAVVGNGRLSWGEHLLDVEERMHVGSRAGIQR